MAERRFFRGGELRAKKGDAPGITGIASVYDQDYDTGYFTETIAPGAFDDVLKSNPDIRGLFNHDPNNVFARTTNGTLRLKDTPQGLQFDADMPDTQLGRDLPALIDRGDVTGCSFSFDVGDDDWQTQRDDKGEPTATRRVIKRFAKVYDVGPVTFPAYEGTSVSARSAELWPSGVPAEVRSHVPALRAAAEQTKKVDGEDLTRDAFLLVGDPDKTDTWALPWKFSTAEKTKSHLRDALARFDQVEGFSEEALDKAWSKLVMLADHYGIDVADKTRPGKKDDDGDDAERARRQRLRVAAAF